MTIPCTLFALSADPSIGRIDKHLLSKETLLELLISGFTQNKEKICGDVSDPKDTSKWEGLQYTDSNEIKHINWTSRELEGSIELKWLPPTTVIVNLSCNAISGSADLTCLPEKLQFLSLAENALCGTVDLTQLPGSLGILSLYNNNFCGLTDFRKLPKSLRRLNISTTQLEGEIFTFDGHVVAHGSNVKDMRKK